MWTHWVASFLLTNFVQGALALVWCAGLRGAVGARSYAFRARLLEWVLIFPVFVFVLQQVAQQIFSAQTADSFVFARIDLWLASISGEGHGLGFPIKLALGFLWTLTTLIFVVQEVAPLFARQTGALQTSVPHPRLEQSKLRICKNLSGVTLAFAVRVYEEEGLNAFLKGLFRPVLYVSSGLMSKLNDEELDAVLGHEWAHLYYGGPLRMLVIWFLRALQAANPAALIAFRSLVETREKACDELAGWITKNPEAMLSALRKTQVADLSKAVASGAPKVGAREEIIRRGEALSLQERVAAIQLAEFDRPNMGLTWVLLPMLALLLWGIR